MNIRRLSSTTDSLGGCLTQGVPYNAVAVFIDTIVLCSLTALVILVTGVFGSPSDGAALTVEAFETALGGFGAAAVAVCTALFAFATLPGWCFYGEQCCRYLFKSSRAQIIYRCAFILFLIPGAVLHLETVWRLADVMNALMALPNLAALLVLSPQVFAGLREE